MIILSRIASSRGMLCRFAPDGGVFPAISPGKTFYSRRGTRYLYNAPLFLDK
ncbi:MAG: hypothetical protein LBD18_07230 [Treponema sp.]|jgi:hypothetical protein|nr:hypothetical protein [Treponema sp.]